MKKTTTKKSMNLSCHQVQQLMPDAVDNLLKGRQLQQFRTALKKCPDCQREFELASQAKSILGKHLKSVTTPPQIRAQIVSALRSPEAAEPRERQREGWLERLFGSNALVPALTGAVAIILIMLFATTRTGTQLHVGFEEPTVIVSGAYIENDVIMQSVANFGKFWRGEVELPTKESSCAAVEQWFSNCGLTFAPSVLHMKNAEWMAPVVTEYNGVQLAHIIYKVGDQMMYVYEVPTEKVTGQHAVLTIPSLAKATLQKDGYYARNCEPGCTLILREQDGKLLAYVSSMNFEEMKATLSLGRS